VPDEQRSLSRGLLIGSMFGMRSLATSLQMKDYQAHVGAGGRKASAWKAAGVGLACLVVILLVMVAIAMAVDAPEPA
jgi:hypothetical protein